jgi:formylglycine-generating enzyme required for sulfatase activity
MRKRTIRNIAFWAGLQFGATLASTPATAVTIDWVTVGLPGNAADVQNGDGAVGYTYRISKYEVTNAQYTEVLNAVAAAGDPSGLYTTEMGSGHGGIMRAGSQGSYSYAAIAGREQMPVVYVSFWDALRFANWMHNGELTGAQDATTTEDGAYTLTAQGIADNSILRNAGARIVLPDFDEWYKAAYHDALGTQATDWFGYPTGTDAEPTCSGPTSAPNHANCGDPFGDFTPVGSYTGSGSPWGTFDQGGNVHEWSEAVSESGFGREIRGGSHHDGPGSMAVGSRLADVPSNETRVEGFRLVMIPEPATGLLVAAGLIGLAGTRRRPGRATVSPRASGS